MIIKIKNQYEVCDKDLYEACEIIESIFVHKELQTDRMIGRVSEFNSILKNICETDNVIIHFRGEFDDYKVYLIVLDLLDTGSSYKFISSHVDGDDEYLEIEQVQV